MNRQPFLHHILLAIGLALVALGFWRALVYPDLLPQVPMGCITAAGVVLLVVLYFMSGGDPPSDHPVGEPASGVLQLWRQRPKLHREDE